MRITGHGDGDEVAVAALYNAVDVAHGAPPDFTAPEIRGWMGTLVADPAQDARLVWAGDGTLLAVGYVEKATDDGVITTAGVVALAHRGRGLGREMLAWQLARARARHAATAPGVTWQATAYPYETDAPARALLSHAGFRPYRYYLTMRAPTAGAVPAEVPDGLRVTAYEPALLPAVHAAHTEAFADYHGFQPRPLDVWRPLTVDRASFRADLTRLLWDRDEIAAYALVHDGADGDAYVAQVGTRRPWRRRGHAGMLLTHVMAAAAAAGIEVAGLGADAESPTGAAAVYERVGFRTVATTIAYRKEIP